MVLGHISQLGLCLTERLLLGTDDVRKPLKPTEAKEVSLETVSRPLGH